MAYATITVSNGLELKKVPLGFSWTTFFFSGFPALMRGHWSWAIGLFALNMITWGISSVVAAFFYNKVYAKKLFLSGYAVTTLPMNVSEESLKNYMGLVKLPTLNNMAPAL